MKKVTKKAKKKQTKKVEKIGYYHGIVDLDDDAAKKSGLIRIDQSNYNLIKLGAKTSSPYGYPDKYTVLKSATIYIITTKGHAWIAAFRNWDYFKTSPVLKTTKKGKDYLLETENSFYKLERCQK